jgi:trimeric autotransporter adhesin
VYAGGSFTRIAGQSRSKIAGLDAVTGNVTAWNPSLSISPGASICRALAVTGDSVYAAGEWGAAGVFQHQGMLVFEP